MSTEALLIFSNPRNHTNLSPSAITMEVQGGDVLERKNKQKKAITYLDTVGYCSTPCLLGVVEMSIKCNMTNVLTLNVVYILNSMWQGA